MSWSPDAVPRRRPAVRYRVVGEQAVVIVQDAGEAVVLNEVGTKILQLVDGSTSIDQIVQALESHFEVDADELRADLERYLTDLMEAGVLEEA